MKKLISKCLFNRGVILMSLIIPAVFIGMISIVAAQPATLHKGENVRIWSPTLAKGKVSGKVVAISPQSVDIQSNFGSLEIPYNSIRKLEIANGQRSHPVEGLLIGMSGGALFGAVLGTASYTPCRSSDALGCLFYPSSGGYIGASALLGAAVGIGVGLLVGLSTHSTRWENIPLKPSVGLISTYRGNREYKPGITFRLSLNTH